MEFVVNEWLPEYFKPDASLAEKQLLKKFLYRFLERGTDRIFVKRGSEFERKIYRYAKDYQRDLKTVSPIRSFIGVFIEDINRRERVDDVPISLHEEVSKKLNQPNTNYISDTYLFEAATFTKDKIIVTTDEKLAHQMQDIEEFKVILLTDFLKNYRSHVKRFSLKRHDKRCNQPKLTFFM